MAYNLFELMAMSAPDDDYGYRARAARENRTYTPRALESSPGAECAVCGSDRKTVATDRELVDAGAVCCEGKAA